MAMESAGFPPAHPPEFVGTSFVERYYRMLCESPEEVHKFYQDSSVLSRPGLDGVMTSVTTMQGINDKILSLGCKEFKVEILTADVQASYKEGVIVLVTGYLTGKDNLRRKFTQSFFLAPQDAKSYFVLNDIFRYVDENESPEVDTVAVNVVDENAPIAPLTPDAEPTHVPDQPSPNHTTTPVEEDSKNGGEVCEPSDNAVGSVDVKKAVAGPLIDSSQNDVLSVTESASSNAQVHAPKKSYASIVKVYTPPLVPASTIRVAPVKTEQKLRASVATEASTPGGNSAPESNKNHAEVKGCSIYIRNLPMTATSEQVEGVFKKFGPIKRGGIQVRSFRYEGYCFGFVEFESSSSVQSAIEASPITIEGLQVTVEEKRNNHQVGNGRGRFQPGRGGFQNDNVRSRGKFWWRPRQWQK
ncbi:hypothetical protein L1049_007290 [Liquidambar formosana]|uniref:Uncharacterized protein n=1 Tax=Liquidambar formosana TaxID=63359 RepID=A0AAP0RII2_LIQFO